MSVEGTWDLRCNSTPRSLCVYYVDSTSDAGSTSKPSSSQDMFGGVSGSTNPFDDAPVVNTRSRNPFETAASQNEQRQGGSGYTSSGHNNNTTIATVFGTEHGSLHYRTYSTPHTIPKSMTRGIGSGRGSSGPLQPLGVGGPATSSGSNLPSSYLPIDVSTGSYPGSIVSIIRVTTLQQPVFLLLVDDNRGSASTLSPSSSAPSSSTRHHHQSGAYATYLIKLHHDTGTFSSVGSGAANKLPRMSSATFHASVGFVYGSGWTLSSIYPEILAELENNEIALSTISTSPHSKRGRSSSAANKKLNHHHDKKSTKTTNRILYKYDRKHLPSPGVRSGQNALELISNGRVAIVAIGNSFYAVTSSKTVVLEDDTHHGDGYHHGGDDVAVIGSTNKSGGDITKLIAFTQSSQVHPVIVVNTQDQTLDDGWHCLFVASGRECAIIDVYIDDHHAETHHGQAPVSGDSLAGGSLTVRCGKPRHNDITTLASPILAAAASPTLSKKAFSSSQRRDAEQDGMASSSSSFVCVLTSDGIITIRSPSCMAIPLRTVEVGTRPNDYFVLRTLLNDCDQYNHSNQITGKHQQNRQVTQHQHHQRRRQQQQQQPYLVAISYSREGKVLQCQPDTAQGLADRLMRLSIDAFGANGFPRSELAEAVNASFTSTSYVGPEPNAHSRSLLKQYLEAVLGLADFDSGGASRWPMTEIDSSPHSAFDNNDAPQNPFHGVFDEAGISATSTMSTSVPSASPTALVTGTSLLCLVCTQLSPPNVTLANRASKSCASKVGVVFAGGAIPTSAVSVGEVIAEKLLREASTTFSLLNTSPSTPIIPSTKSSQSPVMELTEAAVWLLRSCGRHDRAIEVLHERLQQHQHSNLSTNSDGTSSKKSGSGFWSQIKYESYTATHLSELWGSGEDQGCRLVLRSSATRRLLENNPRLGLSVFTATHPQNESQWRSLLARDDPLNHPSYPIQVVELLKAVNPVVPYDPPAVSLSADDSEDGSRQEEGSTPLPLESGRALAVAYLESAIGISTGKPTEEESFDVLPPDEHAVEKLANLHDELSYLLLEGVIAERGDEDDDTDTELGKLYRAKLRRLLRWPKALVHSERLLSSLPSSFLQEQALLLGRLDRHEDALRILYCDLQSLELALEYCDARYERQRSNLEQEKSRRGANTSGSSKSSTDCVYLPLVNVALHSDPNSERGITAAIQVLALRRSSIDRAAALRLLPHNVPVSAVARPFLIPALVDSESQVRRLTVTASLLRAKYVSLKKQLTEAQIKAQSNLSSVPGLRSLNLGDPLHSSKPFKARPAHLASPTFPDVVIVKHFFPRHLIIQVKVTNSAPAVDGRTLGDVTFVVAESSEEAIQPTSQVPLKALPYYSTGSAWCVLAAAPQRIDGTATLTCELRYTVMAVDATTGAPLSFGGGMRSSRSAYVEELQDMDVHANHFL